MYKDIETIYKKKSPYNKIKIRMFLIYFISIPFLLCFNYYRKYIMMIMTMIIIIFIIKKESEKILSEKLCFNFFKQNRNTIYLDQIVEKKEKALFIDYLKNKSIYNKETIKCILNHYRCYLRPKIIGENFISILSIIISISLAFISKDGFDISSFSASIPYLISIIFLFFVVYYPISKVAELKKFFSGEDGMHERLENIFSELYIDFNKKNNKKLLAKKIKIEPKNINADKMQKKE